jgi:hypothetical protein
MKTPEQDRLLNDVLKNESYLAFRAELRQKPDVRTSAGSKRE